MNVTDPITRLTAALEGRYRIERQLGEGDMKPANILLHAARPLIADFGIALAVGAADGGRLTETGLVFCSASGARGPAPEAFAGRSAK